MHQDLTNPWTEYLRRSGLEPRAVLGSGMEGTVVELGDDLVAKIWQRRPRGELEALQRFYEAVAAAAPGIRTPRILQVLTEQDDASRPAVVVTADDA